MIRTNRTITEIIQSHNPKEVTEQLNKLLEDKAIFEPVITSEDYHPAIGHYAKVRWQETFCEPENAKDRAELKGKSYYCGECPFFVLHHDRRIKYSVCNEGHEVWFDKPACIGLYEKIEKGEIEL